MGSARRPLREQEHLARADRHRTIGTLLAESGDEWGAVPLFYSAYHRVKAALLRDPIWEDIQSLHVLSVDLIPEDRFTGRHQGRRRPGGQPREWGVNDLVLKLYRPAAGSYERLHQASIDVRYGAGLPGGALPSILEATERIEQLDRAGSLQASIPSR